MKKKKIKENHQRIEHIRRDIGLNQDWQPAPACSVIYDEN